MHIGALRHRVTIQQRSTARDSYGQPVDDWPDVATVRAAVEPLNGRELMAAQQINSEITLRVTIRFRPGITSAMRIKYGSRTFDILAPLDQEERHIELWLMCKELTLDAG